MKKNIINAICYNCGRGFRIAEICLHRFLQGMCPACGKNITEKRRKDEKNPN